MKTNEKYKTRKPLKDIKTDRNKYEKEMREKEERKRKLVVKEKGTGNRMILGKERILSLEFFNHQNKYKRNDRKVVVEQGLSLNVLSFGKLHSRSLAYIHSYVCFLF